MAQTVRPNPKQYQHQEIHMISAEEARKMTNEARFVRSGSAEVMNTIIRDIASDGGARARMLISAEMADQARDYLTGYGFRVACNQDATGVLIVAEW